MVKRSSFRPVFSDLDDLDPVLVFFCNFINIGLVPLTELAFIVPQPVAPYVEKHRAPGFDYPVDELLHRSVFILNILLDCVFILGLYLLRGK